MMSRLSDHLEPLAEYAKASREFELIQTVTLSNYPASLCSSSNARPECSRRLWGFARLLQTSTTCLCGSRGGCKKYPNSPRAATLFAANARPLEFTSIRIFIRVQWEPFEASFGSIDSSLQHHMGVLLHSTQALQFNATRDRKHRESGRCILRIE
jgi:hypothetical protein